MMTPNMTSFPWHHSLTLQRSNQSSSPSNPSHANLPLNVLVTCQMNGFYQNGVYPGQFGQIIGSGGEGVVVSGFWHGEEAAF